MHVSKVARSLVTLLSATLVASVLQGLPASAKPAGERLKAQAEKLDNHGGQVKAKGSPDNRLKNAALPKAVWPASSRGPAKVDKSPVRAHGAQSGLEIEVLGREKTPAAWRNSLLVRVGSSAGNGKAGVSIDYNSFRYASGGDWASRLKLWQVPDCALTSPEKASCKPTPLATTNDVKSGVASADVPVTAAKSTMIALAASSGGSGGDFAATSLSPSATWSAGGSSGDFSWSYPLRMPPAAGGMTPQIGLSYSSSSVDGRSEATNNQPSWLGEGFEYSQGFIERRYVPCAEDMKNGASNTQKTGDLCWRSDNATMTLNGKGGELVFESGKGWHSRSEDGSKIERLTGAPNGDNDGEYWKVTTADGTQYFFGQHSLPGQSAGTNSAWTVPVFGNHAGEPCKLATHNASFCNQVWRWNLDYVVDVRGNTMSFWYDQEVNHYARNGVDTDKQPYVRGGALRRIDYGTYYRTAAEHGVDQVSVTPFAQVVFDTADRCLANCWNGSDAVKENWPDTPFDQECKSSAANCQGKYSPTFWTTKRLSKVTTKVWDTTKTTPAWQDVESWSFTHAFPSPGDGTHAGLWLDSIVHSGHVGGTVNLPAVTFEPTSLPNRILTTNNTTNNWLRISNIKTETGARIHVDYSSPECHGGNLPSAPHTNTMRCYPVMVPDPSDPTGERLKTEWWHKYTVSHIAEEDVFLADGHQAPTKNTWYDYVGAPAWHYADEDGLSRPETKTWSQFRGYATVKVRTGTDPVKQSLQITHFMRGMHGDKASPSGGTRTVTVPATLGSETVYDEDQFAGQVRETQVFNGVDTKPVSKSVNVPWRSNPTASRTINGDLVESRYVNTQKVYSATALGVDGSRGWRTTATSQGFDQTYGMPDWSQDHGDINASGDEKCTTYSYNRNTAKNLLAPVKRVTAIALPCGQNPSTVDQVLSDVRNYYDGASSVDTVPTYGSQSKVELLKEWTPATGTQWQTVTQATFDKAGRPLTATDLRGNTTTTAYTPAVGGPVTKVTSTGPAPFNWVTTAEVLPYWGSAWKNTDQNGKITGEATYDALGRVAKVWNQGWSRSAHPTTPSTEYTYSLPANRDTYTSIETKTLNAKGNYVKSFQILDGMYRNRQSQTISLNGDGSRIVADTIYDEFGRASTQYGAHAEPNAPSGTLWWEPEWSVPTVTKTEFDRASRPVASVFYSGDNVTNLVEKFRSVTAFEGDLTKTTPPAGGTPTTTVTDVNGKTVALRQHTTAAGVSGAYHETKYVFNSKDQAVKVIDPAGNEWTTKYDTRGRQIEAVDPDSGKVTTEYNDYNEIVKTTDARGKALYYVYDTIGRKKELRNDSATGALRAEWKYDSLYSGQGGFRGQMTQAIRYEPAGTANAYKWQVRSLDDRYQPGGINIVIPAAEGGLADTYAYGYGYSTYTGAPTTLTYPAAGDLVAETVTTDYDSVTGMPLRLDTNRTGQTGTMVAQWYTALGEPNIVTRKLPGGVYVDETIERDTFTRRITRTSVQPETATGTVSDRSYSYDLVGNITSIVDKPQVGQTDKQCFRHDQLLRLTKAWTPKEAVDCSTDPTLANLAGPAPYWMDWTVDTVGNRLTEVSHTSAGDTTRTYTVPTGGAGVVRPHVVTGMSTTAPSQSAVNSKYAYDNSGNMTCRPNSTVANDCATGANSQTITWNAENKPEQIKVGANTVETNVYDVNGQRLIRRDATGTTLYLPGQEIRREGTVNTGTRYYSFGGQVCAMRTAAGATWLFNDHQGTQQLSVKADTQAVATRYQTPYGAARGTNPSWPNGKGFVGGDKDATGLVHIGARKYDMQLGRFISDDPITDVVDPQQMHGYSYSSNSPITFSDPTGLQLAADGGEGGGSAACTKSPAECNATEAKAEVDRLEKEKAEAEKLKKTSFTEILIKAGLSLLLDMLGITDIINCFTKGDFAACGSMLLSALPVGRVFKMGKAIFKAVEKGFSAYKVWKKTVAAADAILSKADSALAAAKGKLDEATSALGKLKEPAKELAADAAWGAFGGVAGQAVNEIVYNPDGDVEPMNLVFAAVGGATGNTLGRKHEALSGAIGASSTNAMVQMYGDQEFSFTQMIVAGGIGATVGGFTQKAKNAVDKGYQEFGGPVADPKNRGTAVGGGLASGLADFSGMVTGWW